MKSAGHLRDRGSNSVICICRLPQEALWARIPELVEGISRVLPKFWIIRSMVKTQSSEERHSEFLAAANKFADEARSIVQSFAGMDLSSSLKADKSIVTAADIEIEKVLRQRIAELFPDHGVIGEEFPATNPQSPYQWILDPIDGTEEFAHGLPTFGCIISLEHLSVPVVGLVDHPALNLRLVASRGGGTYANGKQIFLSDELPSKDRVRLGISKRLNFSRYGDEGQLFDSIVQAYPNLRVFDSCFAYSCAANGGIDAMIDYNVRIWDISACKLLCEEAGGAFTWIKKQETPQGLTTYGAVFGKKAAVKQIVDSFFPNVANNFPK